MLIIYKYFEFERLQHLALCLMQIPVFQRRKRQRRGRLSAGSGDGDVQSDTVETPLIGGSWRPNNCTSRHRIAVVIPYRDRQHHLRLFLRHMHPFLQRQLLDYTIYVVEQVVYSSTVYIVHSRD